MDACPSNDDPNETYEWPQSDVEEDIPTESAPIMSTSALVNNSKPSLDPSLPSFDCSLPGAEQLENLPNEQDVIPGSPLPSTLAQVRNKIVFNSDWLLLTDLHCKKTGSSIFDWPKTQANGASHIAFKY